MPDKPKRRKNKNKRKNKNNKSNVNKSETSDTISVDSCDCQEENANDGCENNQCNVDNKDSIILENANLSQNDIQNLPSISEPSTLVDECKSNDYENVTLLDKVNVRNETTDLPVYDYVVESPDVKKKKNPKINSGIKSKSLDNDESPNIVEISEESDIQCEDEKSLPVVNTNNIIITDAESDVEWEKTDELHEVTKTDNLPAEALSVMTPLQIAQCQQTQFLNLDQEKSLRSYLQSLNLETSPPNLNSLELRTEIEQIINREIKQRLRKKGFVEDSFFPRGTISRGLDVIDEEGSSESSATSRRHSYLSDKKSDTDDLEDEVFEKKQIIAYKSNNSGSQKLIPQQCILVDAKIKEPEISEARGDWSLKKMETVTGAEVVYLTDSSSSTSSIYEVGDDMDNDEVSDTSIRIITPTIEVTDTEKFLTNTFIAKEKEKELNTEKINKKIIPTDINVDDLLKINNEIITEDTAAVPSQNPHEIVVLSTEDIKTNLFVKDINVNECKLKSNIENDKETKQKVNKLASNLNNDKEKETYDLEIKVLKCELNDAINNLIKEFTPDSETTPENHNQVYTRQDSSSSVCSSQSTAKYNPTYSSLNDVSNMHEDTAIANCKSHKEDYQESEITSHVKEVFKCVAGDPSKSNISNCADKKTPLSLRDLCVKKISSLPYGNKVLEELAHVSKRLQSMSILALQSRGSSKLFDEKTTKDKIEGKKQTKMPYFPLPDISNIEKISLSTKDQEQIAPPVQPRHSSLKKSHDDHWTAIPTAMDPLYVCLSPSQKMLMEKTNTVIKKEDASQLMDIHKKFVDRRGYNEKFNNNVDTTPIVPFKSQTGSRLLALIRDPSVTNNISLSSPSSQNKHFKSVESLPKLNYADLKYSSKESDTFTDSDKYSKSFKPIPPPRPKKYSSSFYESDESSDFTDNSFRSMRSEKKVFHFSTGNLNKEIENDISTIQNMHRYYSNIRDSHSGQIFPRRPSLPKDLCEQQMEYIRQKEKEVEEEIRRIEEERKIQLERKCPRAPLVRDDSELENKTFKVNRSNVKEYTFFSDHKSQNVEKGKISSVFSKSQEELLREKMYTEYVNQMAEREQRRQQKCIKITRLPSANNAFNVSKSMPTLDDLESKVNNRIEKEFINRARQRWQKLGIADPETEDEKEVEKDIYREPKVIEHKIKVIQAGEEKDVTKLPNHLQEFVSFTARAKEQANSSSGELEPWKEPAHVVVCAVIILVWTVGKYVLRLLRNK